MWAKEKELRQLQEHDETARDSDVKRAVHDMTGVTVEALKLNFKRDQLPGLSRIAIMERKKRTMDVKWISREQAECVTSAWEPMPYPFDGQEFEYDDQNIFIIPSSSFFLHFTQNGSFVTNSEPAPIYTRDITLVLRNKQPPRLGTIPFLSGMNRNHLNRKGTRGSEQQWICQ